MLMPTRGDLAAYAVLSPESMLACSRALARYADAQQLLASHASLPSMVWRQLWDAKPSAEDAFALVSRPLALPDREAVLAREKRARVLAQLVRYNVLTRGEQETLIRRGVARPLEVLLEQEWTDPEIRLRTASTIGGLALLKEIAYGPLEAFDDQEVSVLLDSFDEWVPDRNYKDRSAALRAVLARRPALLTGAAAASSDAVVTAAAGTLGLSDRDARAIALLDVPEGAKRLPQRQFAILALVSNPTVCLATALEVARVCERLPGMGQVSPTTDYRRSRPDVVEDPRTASDPAELRWMLGRALPSDYHPARLFDLLALAENPHFEPSDEEEILVELRALCHESWRTESLVRSNPVLVRKLKLPVRSNAAVPQFEPPIVRYPFVDRFCQAAEQALGGDAQKWEVLVGLLGEFDGTPEELIGAASAL